LSSRGAPGARDRGVDGKLPFGARWTGMGLPHALIAGVKTRSTGASMMVSEVMRSDWGVENWSRCGDGGMGALAQALEYPYGPRDSGHVASTARAFAGPGPTACDPRRPGAPT